MADIYSTVINKLDESFSPQDSQQYGLAVIFGETSFCYTVLDFKRNKYIGLQQMVRNDSVQRLHPQNPGQSFDEFMKRIFMATPWLKNAYKVVRVAYEGNRHTLLPAALHDPSEIAGYLNFTHVQAEDERVFADHLIPLDAYQVFSIPAATLATIRNYFPRVTVSHSSSVLIESIWFNYKNRINTNRVFLNIRQNMFDMAIFDGRQLTYFNSFSYRNNEDVAYYLIFVLEQLNFNPESIPVILLGNIEKGGALFELIYRYIRHVEFGRRNENFKYSYLFNQVPPQMNFPLMNFLSCSLSTGTS
jgi:hypothetical protein